jgi:hypothetical protein
MLKWRYDFEQLGKQDKLEPDRVRDQWYGCEKQRQHLAQVQKEV